MIFDNLYYVLIFGRDFFVENKVEIDFFLEIMMILGNKFLVCILYRNLGLVRLLEFVVIELNSLVCLNVLVLR